MTQEEKQLLLVDLCGRLTCGVKVLNSTYREPTIQTLLGRISEDEFNMKETYKQVSGEDYRNVRDNVHFTGYIDYIKPYLRPMSSMTEEEWKELNRIGYIVPLYDGCFGVDIRAYCKNGQPHYRRFSEFSTIEDWLNKHHFDYRTIYDEDKKKYMSMIEKGLALEAPEGMYDK